MIMLEQYGKYPGCCDSRGASRKRIFATTFNWLSVVCEDGDTIPSLRMAVKRSPDFSTVVMPLTLTAVGI